MSSLLHDNLFSLRQNVPSAVRAEHTRSQSLSRFLHETLDRVHVLGDDDSYGHTGCVNALSWAQNGELLLSGGDDTTVRLWKMDLSDTKQEYPFVCRSVVHTGHTANIFNAQLLPYSTHLVTVAGDSQVRVSDLSTALTSDGVETRYTTRECLKGILRCHTDRVKRIVTEDSPALFLTVSEDGSIRQHDLRTPHNCRQGTTCPAPLLKLDHDLSTVSLSTLTPYQLVVAGESPYGYLFDRRNMGRRLQEEWGVPSSGDEITTCVRRFGRQQKEETKIYRRDHITGSRMSNYNGHEVLLSYSGDGVYIFSTLDAPCDALPSLTFVTDPTPRATKPPKMSFKQKTGLNQDASLDSVGSEDLEGEETDQDELEDEKDAAMDPAYLPSIPTVMPRLRYAGARNVRTVKDVNFIGPNDDLVVSGSDDGNFFVWDKFSGDLRGVYEGDGNVVNVIEGHPSLPLLAVSGIDTTVKLFAPSRGPSQFSRIGNVEKIVEANARPALSPDLRVLLEEVTIRSGTSVECIHQ